MAYSAYLFVNAGITAQPIFAGFDKFFQFLPNRDAHLVHVVTRTAEVAAPTFLFALGVVEIVAGLLVSVRPQIVTYIVALPLLGIIVDLLLVRDDTASFVWASKAW